jgi:hypothetical protein
LDMMVTVAAMLTPSSIADHSNARTNEIQAFARFTTYVVAAYASSRASRDWISSARPNAPKTTAAGAATAISPVGSCLSTPLATQTPCRRKTLRPV